MPRGEGTAPREGPIDPGGFEVEDAGLGLHAYVYDIGSYHFNWHEELELLTIVRGEIEVRAGGRARTCTSGEMTLINPHQGHATLALSAGARALAVHFSPHVLEGVTPDWPANRFASMPGDSPRQLPRRHVSGPQSRPCCWNRSRGPRRRSGCARTSPSLSPA